MSIDGIVKNSGVIRGKITAIPSVDKTLTKANRCAEAKATGEALDKKVNIVDVVDNLTTTDSTKPLSARQGVEIKKKLDNIIERLTAIIGE